MIAKPLFFLFLLIISTFTNAKLYFIDTKSIPNFTKTLNIIKKQVNLPILFPSTLPKSQQQNYFVNFELTTTGTNKFYLYIDSSKDCHGAHYCNIGMLYVSNKQSPELNDLPKQKRTESILLAKNLKGYFTPGYAMADYHRPEIQWVYRENLYTLTWDTDKSTLTSMANSAIIHGPW